MDIGVISAILFSILIIAIIINSRFYVLAVKASDKPREYLKNIPDLQKSIREVDSQLQELRPVFRAQSRAYLYTDIDNTIRSAYIKAESEILEGSNPDITIHIFDPPPATVRAMFDLKANRRILSIHYLNKAEYEELESHLLEAQNQVRVIRAAIEEEKRINSNIGKKLKGYLQELKQRVAELNKIRTILGEKDYLRIHILISFMHDRTDKAMNSLSMTVGQDNINYARATVLLIGLKNLLQFYDLDFKVLKITSNYDLDISKIQISNAETRIKEKISGIAALSFGDLGPKAIDLEDEKTHMKSAAEVFDQFTKERSTYESKRGEVCELNLGHPIQAAQTSERDLGAYWGSPTESPSAWSSLLQKKELPSLRLSIISDRLKKICGSEILNMKQSELYQSTAGLDSILKDITDIQKGIDVARKAVEENKRAESQTQQRIGPNGSSRLAYEKIVALTDKRKCSPRTEEKVKILEEQYLNLSNRAKVRKKANYPDILKKLAEFEADAKAIKAEHDKEISGMRGRIEKCSKQLGELKSQFLSLSPKFPTEDRTWEKFAKVFDEIQNQYLNTGDSFPKMAAYEETAQRVVKWLTTEQEKIDMAISKFTSQRDGLKSRVQEGKKEALSKAQMVANTPWRMPLKLKLDSLADLLDRYDELANKLDKIMAGPLKSIPANIASSREELLGLNGEISEQIGEINSLEQRLNEALDVLQNALDRAIDNGLSRLRQGEVTQLIEQAKGVKSVKVAFDILSREAIEKLGQPSIEFNYKKTDIFGDVGTNIEGDLNIRKGGKFVAGNDYSQSGLSGKEVISLFQMLNASVDKRSGLSDAEKLEIKGEIEKLSKELSKKERAKESILMQHLRNIGRMAPDIFDVAVATMANPFAGFSLVAKKVAKKAKASPG